MVGRDETSTVTYTARTDATRLAQVASQREQALTTFYDQYSASGLGRLRRLLNDALGGRRRAGPPRARRFMDADAHATVVPTEGPTPVVSETNDSDHDHPGIIDHSRHVSSIGRR